MIIIEVAVRGQDPRLEKIADAMIQGLRDQMGATPWKLVASLTDNHGRDAGYKSHTNAGRAAL